MTAIKSAKDAAQKKREFDWLLAFQEKCPDCPRSIPDQPNPPAPDFIFPERRLGIEVTEYLLGQCKEGSHPRQLESVRRRIAREAQSEYESHIKHCLQVTIIWATEDCPTKREEKSIAQALAQLVAARTSENRKIWRIEWDEFKSPILQRYVQQVSICLLCERGQSCWSSAAAFWLWEAEKRVQVTLDGKEPKVREYRNFCRELWLLIVADGSWLSSSFFLDQSPAQAELNSSFDRVYVLDESNALVHEFKIEKKPRGI